MVVHHFFVIGVLVIFFYSREGLRYRRIRLTPMAAVEYDEEEARRLQREERKLNRALDARVPLIKTVGEFTKKVLEDPEYLVVVHVLADGGVCPYSTALRPHLVQLARPQKATAHARHYRVDVRRTSPEVLAMLRVSQVPAVSFYLQGASKSEVRGVSNPEKVAALFRNALIERNEVMHDYDEAKKPKPEPEDEEAEEGEEGEDMEE
jgi:thioredoxin-like negative regulator of GroEL